MKDKYTEDEINAFYEDFGANYESYKGKNDDAFDIMNASIDFAQFKKQMLEFKKGITNTAEADQQKLDTNASGQDFFKLMKEDYNDAKLNWSKVCTINQPTYTGEAMRRPIPGK